MPKITDLKTQIKKPDRVSVYVDGKFAMGLGLWQLGRLGLKVGKELSADDVLVLKQDSDFGKLIDKSLRWLSIRKRSAWEVEDYLKKKTDNVDLRDNVYEALLERSYINDVEFAESWVRSRRATKLVSKRRLEQELRAKRVDQAAITTALQEDETEDNTTLKLLIEKKQRQTRYQDQTKLMQYLIRQGFSYGDVKSALSRD